MWRGLAQIKNSEGFFRTAENFDDKLRHKMKSKIKRAEIRSQAMIFGFFKEINSGYTLNRMCKMFVMKWLCVWQTTIEKPHGSEYLLLYKKWTSRFGINCVCPNRKIVTVENGFFTIEFTVNLLPVTHLWTSLSKLPLWMGLIYPSTTAGMMDNTQTLVLVQIVLLFRYHRTVSPFFMMVIQNKQRTKKSEYRWKRFAT